MATSNPMEPDPSFRREVFEFVTNKDHAAHMRIHPAGQWVQAPLRSLMRKAYEQGLKDGQQKKVSS